LQFYNRLVICLVCDLCVLLFGVALCILRISDEFLGFVVFVFGVGIVHISGVLVLCVCCAIACFGISAKFGFSGFLVLCFWVLGFCEIVRCLGLV